MFRRFGIRARLLTLLAVPTAALLLLSGLGVLRATAVVDDAGRMQTSIAQLEAAGGLIEALQGERQASVLFVRSGRSDGAQRVGTARTATDAQIGRLEQGGRAAPDGLAAHRSLILGDAETGMTDEHVASRYDAAIAGLIDAAEALGGATGDVRLTEGIDGWSRLARYSELTWRERTLMTAVLRGDGMTPGERLELADLEGAVDAVLEGFAAEAPAGAVARIDRYLDDPRTESADTIRRLAIGLHTVGAPGIGFEPAAYDEALAWELDQVGTVSDQLISDLYDRAQQIEAEAQQEQALLFGVAAIAVLLGLLLALVTTRSLVRPLRHLDHSARQLRERLPAAVERLSRPDGQVDIDQVLPEGTRAGDLQSTPELERLGEALDDVGHVAIEVAGDQARLRAGVSEMFTNFARRNQRLLDRQLGLIDALESEEDDPDRLAELFSLDHLATRMRRNAESLLVLAGDESRPASARPIPAADVVRAAISEIEDYQRVEISATTAAHIVGRATASLAHLLAELLENATSFSPPTSPVTVAIARSDDEGVRFTVTDRGIGMSEEALTAANERITDPPLIDAAVSRLLGFYVVGRLATRLSTSVRLSAPRSGGLRAVVTVPAELVADPSELAGTTDDRSAAQGALPAPAPPAGGPAGDEDAPPLAGGPQRREPATERTASGLAKRGGRTDAPAEAPAPGGTLRSFASARRRADREVAVPAGESAAEPLPAPPNPAAGADPLPARKPAPGADPLPARTASPFAALGVDEAASPGDRTDTPPTPPHDGTDDPPHDGTDDPPHDGTDDPPHDGTDDPPSTSPELARGGAGNAGPLPPRTPRRVPAAAPTAATQESRRPLSPDTIASTLSSLQSAWRQVNDATGDIGAASTPPARRAPRRGASARDTSPGDASGGAPTTAPQPGTGRGSDRPASPDGRSPQGPSSDAPSRPASPDGPSPDGPSTDGPSPTASPRASTGGPSTDHPADATPRTDRRGAKPDAAGARGDTRAPRGDGPTGTSGDRGPGSGTGATAPTSPRRRPRRSTTPSWSTPWPEKEEGR